MKTNHKKSIALMAIAVTSLLLIVGSATYAYFSAQMGGGTGTSINATTGTTDSLSFSVGKDIEIKADMDNFLEGMENRHGETTATATLKANNTTNSATARYNLFFIIDQNDFEYSTVDGQAELLMKVTDPNGNEIMDITGLKRVEGGFDITTRTGGFLVMADYDIEATPEKTLESQTWKLEVTFVNLDVEQNINKGKTLNGRFYITKEQESTYELAKINNIEATPAYNTITANLSSLPGTAEIDKYYYAIEEDVSDIAYLGAGVSVTRLSKSLAIQDNDYIESDQPTHTFTNLKPSTKYKIYSYAKDIYGIKSNVYETSITTGDYELAKVLNVTETVTLNSITVTATAEGGINEVSKYYFSKDNGATWSEGQDSNTYTFTDLLDTTEYKIKVKVIDTNDIYSTEYTKTIATTTYVNPSITIVNATKTYNSISLTTTATGGTNSVAKYYYKVGTGSWSAAQTANTYNITTGLTENTTYTIKVKVEDTFGRMSNEYTLDVTTNTYVLPSVSATTSATANSITIDAIGTNGDGTIAKYMYSKDGGSNWITQNSTSTTDSYTFESLTSNTTYQIRVKVVDNNNRESTIYSTSVATSASTKELSSLMSSLYYGTGRSEIAYHGPAAGGAEDKSYRFYGANPNNYICFGSNEETCPEDNLYRIIGDFDYVKIIKNTPIGNYSWSGSASNSSNVWADSTLNTNILNGSYLNGLRTAWSNKIVSVSGTKISLMSTSDYKYAAPSASWSTALSNYDADTIKANNWLYSGTDEWTITRITSGSTSANYINSLGKVLDDNVINTHAVRPVFSLDNSVMISGGTGTKTDPYRIEYEAIEFTFTYSSTNLALSALEGMTWREWCVSSYMPKPSYYNTFFVYDAKSGYYPGLTGENIAYYTSGASSIIIVAHSDNTLVSPDETIVEGEEYTYKRYTAPS